MNLTVGLCQVYHHFFSNRHTGDITYGILSTRSQLVIIKSNFWAIGKVSFVMVTFSQYADQCLYNVCRRLTFQIETHSLRTISSLLSCMLMIDLLATSPFINQTSVQSLSYLWRALQLHRRSCGQSMETVRWRIWTAAGCHDNTERQLLQQVQSLGTDHTVCSWTTSVLNQQDWHSSIRRWNYRICTHNNLCTPTPKT